ncbi:acyl-CoA dehydrogenase family protein [Nocardioides alcanivorans]|uniref:acyl-CoA dehydrogenase family protein n=1 Tax=Nocardioides alcanivorans TaxID=2897352 RepID=UPI001F44D7CB|nr:acyl-CoA dehydrogenase family protein [Nocardioides alcanivorans]
MTDDELTPDEVRGALRDYFAAGPAAEGARRLRDADAGGELEHDGFDRAEWRRLAEQLGLAAMATPEEWGGLGLGVQHLVAAVEECGVALTPGPIRATALLGWALAGAEPEAAGPEWTVDVERFLTGEAVAGFSHVEDGDCAEYVDAKVSGRLASVTHGAVADLVVARVRAAEGPAIALVRLENSSTGRDELPVADLTARLAHVVVEDAPALLLTAPGDLEALLRHFVVARLLLAAEQVGGAEGCLAEMVDYAGVRSQFGQLIGTYQAIQHHCSNTALEVVAARALVAAGAAAADGQRADTALAVSLLARGEAATAFHAASRTLIQVSGGIGFTWEHDAHLFFRRARATASTAGTPDQHRHRAVEAGCLDLLVTAV